MEQCNFVYYDEVGNAVNVSPETLVREQIWCDLKEKYPVNVEESFNYATLIQHIRNAYSELQIVYDVLESVVQSNSILGLIESSLTNDKKKIIPSKKSMLKAPVDGLKSEANAMEEALKSQNSEFWSSIYDSRSKGWMPIQNENGWSIETSPLRLFKCDTAQSSNAKSICYNDMDLILFIDGTPLDQIIGSLGLREKSDQRSFWCQLSFEIFKSIRSSSETSTKSCVSHDGPFSLIITTNANEAIQINMASSISHNYNPTDETMKGTPSRVTINLLKSFFENDGIIDIDRI